MLCCAAVIYVSGPKLHSTAGWQPCCSELPLRAVYANKLILHCLMCFACLRCTPSRCTASSCAPTSA